MYENEGNHGGRRGRRGNQGGSDMSDHKLNQTIKIGDSTEISMATLVLFGVAALLVFGDNLLGGVFQPARLRFIFGMVAVAFAVYSIFILDMNLFDVLFKIGAVVIVALLVQWLLASKGGGFLQQGEVEDWITMGEGLAEGGPLFDEAGFNPVAADYGYGEDNTGYNVAIEDPYLDLSAERGGGSPEGEIVGDELHLHEPPVVSDPVTSETVEETAVVPAETSAQTDRALLVSLHRQVTELKIVGGYDSAVRAESLLNQILEINPDDATAQQTLAQLRSDVAHWNNVMAVSTDWTETSYRISDSKVTAFKSALVGGRYEIVEDGNTMQVSSCHEISTIELLNGWMKGSQVDVQRCVVWKATDGMNTTGDRFAFAR